MALVESHGPTERFHIFTSAFEPEDRRFRSREEALERIAAIRPAMPARASETCSATSRTCSQDAPGDHAYLFTDLQASSHA